MLKTPLKKLRRVSRQIKIQMKQVTKNGKNVDETRPIGVRHGEGSRTNAAFVFSDVSTMVLGQEDSISGEPGAGVTAPADGRGRDGGAWGAE